MKLNLHDIGFILESLSYTKKTFREYPIGKNGYPDYKFKQMRLKEVDSVIDKIRDLKDELKKEKK